MDSGSSGDDPQIYDRVAQEGMGPVLIVRKKETVELAGETYDKLSTTIDENMCQEFYCRRIGNRMATLTISFLPESQSMIDEIVEGIAAP